MNASGYKGTNVNYVAYIPGLLGTSAQLAKAVDGSFVSSQIVPSEENTAYIKQVQSDLQASGAKTGKFMTLADATHGICCNCFWRWSSGIKKMLRPMSAPITSMI